MAGLFENLRPREQRGLSKERGPEEPWKAKRRKKKKERAWAEQTAPLRCCYRFLFSLTGLKKKQSPVQQKREENVEQSTHRRPWRIFIQVFSKLLRERHSSNRQGNIYTTTGNPPNKDRAESDGAFAKVKAKTLRIKAQAKEEVCFYT